MARIKNPWRDGRDCDVIDASCIFRKCLHVSEDKGSFTQGVGYTSYHKDPQLVCMTRHVRGCPYPKPAPDPESARCCPNPNFAKSKGEPKKQRCRTCRAWLSGKALTLVKELPKYPASRCEHSSFGETEWASESCWHCPQCNRWFESRPNPHQVGETMEEFADRRFEKWKERHAKKD